MRRCANWNFAMFRFLKNCTKIEFFWPIRFLRHYDSNVERDHVLYKIDKLHKIYFILKNCVRCSQHLQTTLNNCNYGILKKKKQVKVHFLVEFKININYDLYFYEYLKKKTFLLLVCNVLNIDGFTGFSLNTNMMIKIFWTWRNFWIFFHHSQVHLS